jgi:hypothetical protein
MSRLYAQVAPIVLSHSGSLANSASISGSLACRGYTTLVGGLFTAGSTIAACGLRVDQSLNGGDNWDITSASNAVGSGASAACATAIIGDAIRVTLQIGATGASRVEAMFYLKPV